MEVKLSFWDLVCIAKQFNFNLDSLAIEEDNYLKLSDGTLVSHGDYQYSDAWRVSDNEYKKIFALVSILNEILKFRPLPF